MPRRYRLPIYRVLGSWLRGSVYNRQQYSTYATALENLAVKNFRLEGSTKMRAWALCCLKIVLDTPCLALLECRSGQEVPGMCTELEYIRGAVLYGAVRWVKKTRS